MLLLKPDHFRYGNTRCGMKEKSKNKAGGLQQNALVFFLPAAVLIVIGILISIIMGREGSHILINSHHHPFMDSLMKIWTLLGDGAWVLFIVGAAIFIKMRYFLILALSYILSGLSAQLLKRLVFKGMPRPEKYFELHAIDYDLFIVPGYDPHSWHSFPSGHTATAFGLFFGISLLLRSKLLQVLCLVLALGVAYSRIYLSEHFLMDVLGGAVLGMASAYLAIAWMRMYQKDWLEKPLQKILLK